MAAERYNYYLQYDTNISFYSNVLLVGFFTSLSPTISVFIFCEKIIYCRNWKQISVDFFVLVSTLQIVTKVVGFAFATSFLDVKTSVPLWSFTFHRTKLFVPCLSTPKVYLHFLMACARLFFLHFTLLRISLRSTTLPLSHRLQMFIPYSNFYS